MDIFLAEIFIYQIIKKKKKQIKKIFTFFFINCIKYILLKIFMLCFI